MMRIMLKSKITSATITDAQLYYRGSITVDESLMEAVDLREGEKVDVLNVNNGARLQTYVIKGPRLSGVICLNGPAARAGVKGDKLMVISYGIYTDDESAKLKPKIVELDDANRIKNPPVA